LFSSTNDGGTANNVSASTDNQTTVLTKWGTDHSPCKQNLRDKSVS
jgi:hypothetical protein